MIVRTEECDLSVKNSGLLSRSRLGKAAESTADVNLCYGPGEKVCQNRVGSRGENPRQGLVEAS